MSWPAPSYLQRGVVLLCALSGALITNSYCMLVFALLAVLGIAILASVVGKILRLCARAIVPLSMMLVLVWGAIVKAPPGQPVGTDQAGGVLYALFIALRFAVIASAFQLLYATTRSFPDLMYSWKLPKHTRIVVAGVLALLPEMERKLDQILTARVARGSMGTRTVLRKLAQIPAVLLPLMAISLNTSIDRAETWRTRRTFARFDNSTRAIAPSTATGSLLIILGAGWLVVVLADRLRMINIP